MSYHKMSRQLRRKAENESQEHLRQIRAKFLKQHLFKQQDEKCLLPAKSDSWQ